MEAHTTRRSLESTKMLKKKTLKDQPQIQTLETELRSIL